MPLISLPAVKPTIQQAAALFGRGLSATGRGAAAAGRGAYNVGTNPAVARNLYAPAVGGAIGYGAGTGIESATGLEPGDLRHWTAGVGAAAALARANPAVWNQVRYAADLKPGEKWKPFTSTKNLLVSPRYPGLEPALQKYMPSAAPYVAGSMRALPAVAFGGGAGFAGYQGAKYLPDRTTRLAQEEFDIRDKHTLDRIWWDTFKKQPSILAHMYGVGADKDTTAIGDMHRAAAPGVVWPDVKYGITRARQHYPTLMGTLDTLRSSTPLGAATTKAMTTFAPKEPPDLAGNLANILRDNQESFATDPSLIKSPLARIYGDIFMKNDVMTNPWAQQKTIGRIPTEEQELPVRALARPGAYRLANSVEKNVPESILSRLSGQPVNDWMDSAQPHRDPLNAARLNYLPPAFGDGSWGGPGPYGDTSEGHRFNPYTGSRKSLNLGIGRAVLPTLGDFARKSLGPNPEAPYMPLVETAVGSQTGQDLRRKLIGNVADAVEGKE